MRNCCRFQATKHLPALWELKLDSMWGGRIWEWNVRNPRGNWGHLPMEWETVIASWLCHCNYHHVTKRVLLLRRGMSIKVLTDEETDFDLHTSDNQGSWDGSVDNGYESFIPATHKTKGACGLLQAIYWLTHVHGSTEILTN